MKIKESLLVICCTRYSAEVNLCQRSNAADRISEYFWNSLVGEVKTYLKYKQTLQSFKPRRAKTFPSAISPTYIKCYIDAKNA